MLYPLGRDIFACVKTRGGEVKIHIRHYADPSNTKGGHVVPTQKGVALELKEFLRLLKIQKNLAEDYNQQMSSLFISQEALSAQGAQGKKTDTTWQMAKRRCGRRSQRMKDPTTQMKKRGRSRRRDQHPEQQPLANGNATTFAPSLDANAAGAEENYLQQIRHSTPGYCPAMVSHLPVHYSSNEERQLGQ